MVAVSYDACDLGISQMKPEVNLSKVVENHEHDFSKNPHEVKSYLFKINRSRGKYKT